MDAPLELYEAVADTRDRLAALQLAAREELGPHPGVERAFEGATRALAPIEAVTLQLLPQRRFLVVDDSEDVRFLVSRMIRRLDPDARIETARSATEALDRLRDAREGAGIVVISDYEMGEGPTGIELLAEVRARHPRARRVLLTGHDVETIAGSRPCAEVVLPKDGGLASLRIYLRGA